MKNNILFILKHIMKFNKNFQKILKFTQNQNKKISMN